jgi:hypothetical protein
MMDELSFRLTSLPKDLFEIILSFNQPLEIGYLDMAVLNTKYRSNFLRMLSGLKLTGVQPDEVNNRCVSLQN